MEEWQRTHITQNLPELIRWSRFNVLVKAELVAKNILGQADVEKLASQDALQNQHGQSEIAYHYYQLLMGRTHAYKMLTKALLENNQLGAAKVLINGVPNNVSDKPLTYLGVSLKFDGFKDMEIEVNGNILRLHEFLPNANIEKLQQIFQDKATELEIYDAFIKKQKTFVLANNTVPLKPSFYVPRFLSNRIKIDESTFKADCTDVFVFKNTLPRHQLSQIAQPHFTDASTSQLNNNKITRRFIHLDANNDWNELRKLAKVPIHLVNYEENSKTFLLEDSSAPSDIVKKLGSQNERVYFSEEDFIRQQLSKDSTSSSVCICDTPGMGKTFLLANIARCMTENCVGRIVAFIPLTAFAKDFCSGSSSTIVLPEISLRNILSYICPPQQNPELLLALILTELLRLEIFFDGFDELRSENFGWTEEVFRSITTNFKNVRIYITSRPHMRKELEKNLGVVAYDILPFSHQNQVDFLVKCWQHNKPDCEPLSLQSYATSCLEAVNEALTESDKEIAGIPLLCQLIAEICADKLVLRSIKRGKLNEAPLKISGMYQEFFEKKINLVAKNKQEFDNLKLTLVWHALKLLFPTNRFHEEHQFQNMKDLLTSSEILRVGILQKHSNAAFDFVHRTFAEYLVGQYFATKLQENEMQKSEDLELNSASILKLLLTCHFSNYEHNFEHPVIAFFFNLAMDEVNLSEELKNQGAAFVSSNPHTEFISIQCLCCRHNLLNIFTFLNEALIKCNNSWIAECYTDDNTYKLLETCISLSSSQMFHRCIQLLTEVHKLDVTRIVTLNWRDTLLTRAIVCANYEAVEYLAAKISLRNQRILESCVCHSNNIEKRENILHLLLAKDPTLIHETPKILVPSYLSGVNVKLFKILVEFGIALTEVSDDRLNCVMHAAKDMLPSDFHELVTFLLTECKAEYLFLNNERWADPLPTIIQWAAILPETLELLLNIPGTDVEMKDKNGDNLLFSAVKGNKVNNFQQLVDRGLDYSATGVENVSLLHVSAMNGGVEMVRKLVACKLDPNSCDENNWTPLHYVVAAEFTKLSIVKVLVENGANVQAKTNKGQTALHLNVAQCSTNYEFIKLLSDGPLKEIMDIFKSAAAEAQPNSNKWQIPQELSVPESHDDIYDNMEVVKYLVRKGAGVNDRDNDGNTPLHLCKYEKIKDCLIKVGADVHAKNKAGRTPVQMNPSF